MMVGFQYTNDLNPCSVQVINTSRKDNLLFCSFFIMDLSMVGLSSHGPVVFERLQMRPKNECIIYVFKPH